MEARRMQQVFDGLEPLLLCPLTKLIPYGSWINAEVDAEEPAFTRRLRRAGRRFAPGVFTPVVQCLDGRAGWYSRPRLSASASPAASRTASAAPSGLGPCVAGISSSSDGVVASGVPPKDSSEASAGPDEAISVRAARLPADRCKLISWDAVIRVLPGAPRAPRPNWFCWSATASAVRPGSAPTATADADVDWWSSRWTVATPPY